MKRFLVYIVVLVLLVVVAGGLGYFNYVLKPAAIAGFLSQPRPLTPVAIAEASVSDQPKFLNGIGTIQSVHQVVVAPEVGGRIVQLSFTPGATVKAGDVLIQLNDGPERGDLSNYQAMARNAELQLKRSKELVGRQFTPQATVDQQQAALDEANAQIAKTQAIIAQKVIRAPFDGELGIRQVDLGQFLNPGGAIVSLTNLDHLYVNFTLPERDSSKLSVGQAVQIKVDAFPNRVFDAKLATIEPQIGADTRTIKVQAMLDNPGHVLRPGMFANVAVVLPPQPNVVSIPETAVDYSLYGDSVFLVKQDGTDEGGKPVMKVTRTFVKTGERFNGRVAINQGLQGGDKVAASGQLRLSTGMPVKIIQSDTLATPDKVPTN
jgi:multidrug efflux system membrane fusion protein